MTSLDLDGTEQPIDPHLLMAVEAAFQRVSTTKVEFVETPRIWKKGAPAGNSKGPSGDKKAALRFSIAQRDGAKCAYCAQPFIDLDQATLDHVIPNEIVKHWQPWNLVLACEACNNLKANRVPLIVMPMLCHLLTAVMPLAQAKAKKYRAKERRRAAARAEAQRISREALKAQRAAAGVAIPQQLEFDLGLGGA
ncbi:HNH endonuclease (plasmid) [Streptomyces sp. NEAU-sy36]|uniref:HNH endonuclease n=1 Tax=unclassified Streptomyces TaxID=2593676 RepID=UPI0015D570A1|nr:MULTISPECIES: HNH endonuclease [unclassified Streptomyces]QLJ06706.1 HNH endonuclease [Streptomyces sp. NEAU-sy36]